MNILVFLASPNKKGRTTQLVDRFLAGAAKNNAGLTVDKVFLNDAKLLLCQGKEECRTSARCPLPDKCPSLFEKIRAADLVVLASPNYWSSYTAQLKIFLDRWGVFLDEHYQSRIKGKRFVFAAVCGNPDATHADLVIEDMKKATASLSLELLGELTASANPAGGADEARAQSDRAFRLGEKIARLLRV